MVGFTPQVVRREQIAWNIAMQHSNFVGELVVKAWRKLLEGSLDEWFWTLNIIREVTGQDLTTQEEKDLDSMESKIFPLIKGNNILNKRQFKTECLAYARKIMKILKAQGYFPSKEDRTRLSF